MHHFTTHRILCYALAELVNTLRRKCIKNPSKHNFVLVTKAEEDLSNSIELDRLCFLNGTATNSTSECFKAVRFLSVQSLPQQRHFGKLKFFSEISIVNGFNMFFSDNCNKQHFEIRGVPLQSQKLVYLSELLNIIKPELIYTLLVKLMILMIRMTTLSAWC